MKFGLGICSMKYKKDIYNRVEEIYKCEKRKGKNFKSLFANDGLEKIKIQILELKKAYKSDTSIDKKDTLKKIKELEKKQKDIISKKLKEISNKIENGETNLKFFSKINNENKRVFFIQNNFELYFMFKIIQQELKEEYNIKTYNRDFIIQNLKTLLSDQIPKIIIRLDIKSFFESLNQRTILSIINNSHINYIYKEAIQVMQ